MASVEKDAGTRDRILDEAEGLFAQKGYRAVTVREITRSAKCNVAGVNYYFGTKRDLYLEVFRSRWIPRALRIRKTFVELMAGEKARDVATVVRALAKSFLEGSMSEEERVRHHQLMARELAQPTEAFDLLVTRVMRPFLNELSHYLRPRNTGEAADESLMLSIWSIMAMVIHFTFAKEAIIRLSGRKYDPEFRERLVDHIIRFALYGIELDPNGARG